MNTFEQVLDLVTELPLEQQELLINIVQHRSAQMRRKKLAADSQTALVEFRKGNFKPQTAEEAIRELRNYLNTPEVE
jgi:hypothetical protein